MIKCPISDDLDISGWNLRKVLGLFSKSNPPLLEWLGSLIIYKNAYGLADRLREMLTTAFQLKRSMHHYLHMARGNYRE